jgi:DNA-binding transcriptional LysR family regulator
LTAAGESLVDYAKRLLLLQDEALAAVEQVGIEKAGRPKSFGQAK